MTNIVKISINGEMIDLQIDTNQINVLNVLHNICVNKGYNMIQFLYKWNFNDYYINIYGWIDGDINKANSHNLPINGDSNIISVNSNEIKLYGDIIITKTKSNDTLYDIFSDDYGEFYNIVYNYKDSTDSSDSDSDTDTYIESCDDDGLYPIENNINKIKTDIKTILSKTKTINNICNSLGFDYNTYLEYDTN
jgi:hypothetical protein